MGLYMDKKISQIVEEEEISTLSHDAVFAYGNDEDRVVEIPAETKDGHVIEIGNYSGDGKPKNIIAVSTQIGCAVGCSFCEIGDLKLARDLSPREIYEQVILMLNVISQFGLVDIDAIEHKISLSKMGEPILNKGLLEALDLIEDLCSTVKISTVFPSGKVFLRLFKRLAEFAGEYKKTIQIQISLISTSDEYRKKIARARLAPIRKIAEATEYWHEQNPNGRKINLSLILNEDTPCDVKDVVGVFSPDSVNFRFRPCVATENARAGGLVKIGDDKLEEVKNQFRDAGFTTSNWATPTLVEQKHRLAAGVTMKRYIKMIGRNG